MKSINAIILVLSLLLVFKLSAQKFEGAIALGVNLSQLEGDNLSGFNKLGFNGGFLVAYPITKKNGLSTGLLYNQKGSSSTLKIGTPQNVQNITLHYLTIPIHYHFNEWYDEELNTYLLKLTLGPSINRLFGVSSSNSFFDNATSDFSDWDLSISAGIQYQLNKKWGLKLNYERSVTKIYKLPNSDLKGLQSYLINFRIVRNI